MTKKEDGHPPKRVEQEVHVLRENFFRVGARPSPWSYIQSIWDYRSFILFDSQSRIAGQASTDLLGRFWLIFTPILNGMTYYLVFGVLLGTSRGIENFVGYLILGVFLFRYTSSSILSGAKSLQANRTVIQAFNFPRATLPIAVNVRESLSHVITLITMFALILAIPPLEPISFKWLMFIPVVLIQFVFNLGLSFLLARLVSAWQDLVHIIGFFTRIWMYLSAVFYSIDRFENNTAILFAMKINPMFSLLDISRDLLLYDTWPELSTWLILIAWTVVVFIVGFFLFWKAEETYGREE